MSLEEKTCQTTTLYGYPRVLMDSEPTPDWKNKVWKDGIGNIDEHCNDYSDGKNRDKALKGDPVTASKYFLTVLLRGEYGFEGYVASDSEAVEYIYTKHRTTTDYKHATAAVLAAGMNIRAAVADILLGHVNPSAKSSFTWPKTVGQIPYAFPYKPESRSSGRARVDGTLYPFAHGLSYTTFKYENLRIENQKPALGEPVKITFTLTNDGSRTGAEVPQLYLQDVTCSINRSYVELAGFERVELKPGESRKVSYTLTDEQLQILNLDMKWVVEPGLFRVFIGASSEDLRLPLPTKAAENKTGNAGFPSMGKSIEPIPAGPLAANEFEVQPYHPEGLTEWASEVV